MAQQPLQNAGGTIDSREHQRRLAYSVGLVDPRPRSSQQQTQKTLLTHKNSGEPITM